MIPTRKFFVLDGKLQEMRYFDPSWLKGRSMVYEVLRARNGKALFLDDHITRMQQTVVKSGSGSLPASEEIMAMVMKLIEANEPGEGNMLFCLIKNRDILHFLVCFIAHRYPGTADYENGVLMQSLNAIRHNPNAKIFNPVLRKKTEYLKEAREVYEILLINKEGFVTEGSRSNIFLILGNQVYTPPAEKVLLGITRQKVLDICQSIGIQVIEKDIRYKDLMFYESAFITGTSPKILPVNHIDDYRFNVSNAIMRKLMLEYDLLIDQDSIT